MRRRAGVNIFLDEGRLPAGVAGVIGTLSGAGLPAPDAALEAGVAFALTLIFGDRAPAPAPGESVGFTLFGWSLDLPRSLLDAAAPVLARLEEEHDRGTVVEFAGQMIGGAAARLGIDATSPPDLHDKTQSRGEVARLLLGMALALHAHTTSYPSKDVSSDAEEPVDPGAARH